MREMRESPPERTPLWWDQVEWGPPAPALSGSLEADAVVIGAGYTGLSAAYHLARAGLKPVVLEAERVGYGASGRNGGIIGAVHAGRLRRQMARLGYERFKAACDVGVRTVQAVERIVSENRIDCEFERAGELCLAHSPRHLPTLQESARLLSDLNYPTVYLDRRALREELNTDLYHGAFLDRQSAHVHPGKYVHGLAQAVRRLGVPIYENSRVTGLQREPGGGRGGNGRERRLIVKTSGGEVRAPHAVVGTNGYTGRLHPFFAGRYYPLRSYIVATEPLSESDWASLGWRSRSAAYDTKIMLYYFRPTRDRRIVFGGRADYAERENTRMYDHLEQAIGRVFPSVRGKYRISHRWHGYLAFTFDRTPRIDRLADLPEVWYAMGYSGHGVGVATFAGEALAANILGRPGFEQVHFNRTPLRRFPLYPLRRVTAPLYLAYCRWQDSR
jgi:glycine/D-amino acid oxidase-like deaminating enzyme